MSALSVPRAGGGAFAGPRRLFRLGGRSLRRPRLELRSPIVSSALGSIPRRDSGARQTFPPSPVSLHWRSGKLPAHHPRTLGTARSMGQPTRSINTRPRSIHVAPGVGLTAFRFRVLFLLVNHARTEGRWLRKPLRSWRRTWNSLRATRLTAHLRRTTTFRNLWKVCHRRRCLSAILEETLFGPMERVCLGSRQQLIGEPWLHAKPFAYCGKHLTDLNCRLVIETPLFQSTRL